MKFCDSSRGFINSCHSKTITALFFFFITSDCYTATKSFYDFGKNNMRVAGGLFSLHCLEMRQKGWMPASWSNMYAIIRGPTFSGPPTRKAAAVWPPHVSAMCSSAHRHHGFVIKRCSEQRRGVLPWRRLDQWVIDGVGARDASQSATSGVCLWVWFRVG